MKATVYENTREGGLPEKGPDEKPRFALISFHSQGRCVISHCELCNVKDCTQRNKPSTREAKEIWSNGV